MKFVWVQVRSYSEYKLLENHSRRYRSCNHIESPTAGTLFHKLKFSLQKAFYITYSTTLFTDDKTIEALANEIELRAATYWNFKQKIVKLMEENKSTRKHKDGWTHLIEYSMKKNLFVNQSGLTNSK
jgi:two-component system, sensor histidine kinase LadS